MRPLSLQMTAFGPFAGDVLLNMDALGERGLYLVTGVTGAGKTTLFDAITFALYGEPSGKSRDAGMLRSKYAKPDTATQVRLTFLHRGQTYTVERTPPYAREKQRGLGTIRQDATATFLWPDGRAPVVKPTEVTRAVVDLLGVNKEQFCQIAMIAQGAFQDLLLAGTEQRSKIFREIFGTQPYLDFQSRVKAKAAKLADECALLEHDMRTHMAGVRVAEQDPLALTLDGMRRALPSVADAGALIQTLIAQDEQALLALTPSLQQADAHISTLDATLGQAEQHARLQAEAEKLTAWLAQNEPTLASLAAALETQRNRSDEKQKHQTALAEGRAALKQYDALAALQADRAQARQTTDTAAQDAAKRQLEHESLAKRLQDARAQLETLLVTASQTDRLRGESRAHSDRLQQLQALQTAYAALTADETAFARAQSAYRHAADESTQARQTFIAQQRLFLDAQAGILAQTLQPGAPCPVCGSTEHPAPAATPHHAPTQDTLDTLQATADRLDTATTTQSQAAATLGGSVQQARRTVEDHAQTLFGASDLATLPASLQEAIPLAQTARDAAQKLAEQARMAGERAQEIKQGIPRAEALLTEKETQQRQDEATVLQKRTEAEGLLQQIRQLQGTLPYPDRSAAQAAIIRVETALQAMEQALNAAQTAYDTARDGVRDSRARLDALHGQLMGVQGSDMEVLRTHKATWQTTRAALLTQQQTLLERRNGNAAALTAITAQAEKLQTKQVERAWLSALSQTVNGTLAGKEHILLETYVQMTYLDRVLDRANTRLMRMSSGQYELTRRTGSDDLRQKSGLELNVTDHYNGTERDVRTLSGGEQFKASLALALGMSDEVQASAGGVRLDTLFIDEGFGTLDEESLSAAVDVLATLSEGSRLVGVISHVQQLKDRIDRQIVVTKARGNGSQIAIRL